MKQKTIFTLNLLMSIILCHAQTPFLVQDFNVGANDSYNQFNFKGITLEENLIFPIVSDEVGEELAILDHGELSLLKDLNHGSASSNPDHFVQFKGKVYFSAFDDTNGGALWVTDGTQIGTHIHFDPGNDPMARPQGLIASSSGFLYYTYNNELFRTDGIVNESIFTEVNFATASQQQSNNYCTYHEEIAFLRKANNVFQIYTIEAGNVLLLGEVLEASNYTKGFGLSQVNQGLIFGLDDTFFDEFTSTYIYDESSQTIETLAIDGENARRLHQFTGNLALAWVGGQGYYAVNGVNGEEALLFSTTNATVNQGEGIENGVYGEKIVFAASQGFFGDNFLVYSDGTSDGTNQLFEISRYISNILISGKYAFIASGTSNFFEPELSYINMEDGTFDNFYNFDQSATQPNSILLLGVQDNKLYFLSTLDAAVGRELYAIDLGINVSTDNQPISLAEYTVHFTSHSFEVQADQSSIVNVDVYSTNGTRLASMQTLTNIPYDISHLKGFVFLRFEMKGKIVTHKFFRS